MTSSISVADDGDCHTAVYWEVFFRIVTQVCGDDAPPFVRADFPLLSFRRYLRKRHSYSPVVRLPSRKGYLGTFVCMYNTGLERTPRCSFHCFQGVSAVFKVVRALAGSVLSCVVR